MLFALHFTLIGNAEDGGVIRLSDDPPIQAGSEQW